MPGVVPLNVQTWYRTSGAISCTVSTAVRSTFTVVPLAASVRYATVSEAGVEASALFERATGPIHVTPITIEITRKNVPITTIFFISRPS